MQLVVGIMLHWFCYGAVLPAEVVVAVLAWFQSVRDVRNLANRPKGIWAMGR